MSWHRMIPDQSNIIFLEPCFGRSRTEENLRWCRLQIFERVCNRAGPVPPGRSGPPTGTYSRERRGGEEWNGGGDGRGGAGSCDLISGVGYSRWRAGQNLAGVTDCATDGTLPSLPSLCRFVRVPLFWIRNLWRGRGPHLKQSNFFCQSTTLASRLLLW